MAAFVTADWVAQRLETPGFLVIDTRFSMRHLMGHLRSAVNVPPPRLRDPQGGLLPAEDLGRLFGEAGLGDDVTPVLYDGNDGRNSAMVSWALEYLGRDDVHVMDVVYDEWKAQGREVLYRPVPLEARQFTGRVNPGVRASIGDIAGSKGLKLVDTRSLEEYNGDAGTGENPGHIPGAIPLPWQDLVGQDGQLVCSETQAQRVFDAAKIDRSDRIVTYCQVGARAAVTYSALKRLGYDVRLYDASFAEWERSGQPVDK